MKQPDNSLNATALYFQPPPFSFIIHAQSAEAVAARFFPDDARTHRKRTESFKG
jgi:hypothetical protein